MAAHDNIVFVDCSAAARTITLPAVTNGRVLIIKDSTGNAATNNITVTPASGLIDGAASKAINVAYGEMEVQCDGTNWFTNKPFVGSAPSFPLLAPAGTVAAPSYAFSGDTGTGIWSIAAENVDISLAGVHEIRLGPGSIWNFYDHMLVRYWDVGTAGFVSIQGPTAASTNYTITLPADAPASNTFLKYNGTNYVWASSTITLAAIGASPNANAATFTSGSLNLEPASASFGGVVTTGTQTLAGAKTFSSDMTAAGDVSITRAASGAQVLALIENSSNTASASARLKISVAGGTADDPAIDFNISGVTDWCLGPRNQSSDDFYLGQGTNPTTNPVFKVTKANLDVTIGGNQSFIIDSTNANPVKYSRSASGVTQAWTNSNTSNTASSEAKMSCDTAGSSAGNPYFVFTIQGTQNYSIGIDNAATNDPFKISRSTSLGTNDSLIVDSDGNLTSVVAMDLAITTAGRGLQVKEGSNAKMGTATLSAGAVTVSTTAVTSTSRIFLTSQSDGGTPGFQRVTARTAGTSFTITSSNAADTSTIAWILIEPA